MCAKYLDNSLDAARSYKHHNSPSLNLSLLDRYTSIIGNLALSVSIFPFNSVAGSLLLEVHNRALTINANRQVIAENHVLNLVIV